MTRVRTPVPPFCMCEFMMTLSSRLSTKKRIENLILELKSKFNHYRNKNIDNLIFFCLLYPLSYAQNSTTILFTSRIFLHENYL